LGIFLLAMGRKLTKAGAMEKTWNILTTKGPQTKRLWEYSRP
jgi:hypothetical protein